MSLRKKDIDLAPDRSDAQMPRDIRPLKRAVAGHIGTHEDRPRQKTEEPAASEPKTTTVEPSPKSTAAEGPSVGEASSGPGGHAATAAPRPEHTGPHGPPRGKGALLLLRHPPGPADPPARDRPARRAADEARPRRRLHHQAVGALPRASPRAAGATWSGAACEIEGAGPRRRLGEFEGGDYEEWDLEVGLDRPDGAWEVASGVTSGWVGPGDELEEGAFSLSRWRDV